MINFLIVIATTFTVLSFFRAYWGNEKFNIYLNALVSDKRFQTGSILLHVFLSMMISTLGLCYFVLAICKGYHFYFGLGIFLFFTSCALFTLWKFIEVIRAV